MPTYALTGAPTVVDDGTSTSASVQNTGTVPILARPTGRQIAAGATVSIPCWSNQRTTLQTSGPTGEVVVTLTAGSPAAGPGPGGVTLDPGAASSMSVSIAGGSWFTDEGLKTAASFPVTVPAPTVLYPAAAASVVITGTVGAVAQAKGMNVTDGSAESFVWTPTTDAERAATGVAAGTGSFAAKAGPNLFTGTQDFTGATVTGISALSALSDGGAWVTSTAYTVGKVVTQGGNRYACVVAHTSGTFATDLAASKWVLLDAVTALAAGNNLSDLASAATARTNLGLGTAATQASGAFDASGAASTAQAAAIAVSAQRASNLSDLASVSTARTNLGLGSAAVLASSAVAQTANDLSDLASASTARTNLGLGTAATQASGAFDTAGAATAAQAAAIAASAQRASNLSDLASASTARTNLGLGTAATMTPSTLAADSAFTGAFVRPAETRGTNVNVAVYYIDPTAGNDANDGLSWKKPKATIQNAINAANTAVQAATIVLSNDRHDVGAGLVITKGQPVTIVAERPRPLKYASPAVYSTIPVGCGPTLYSSTGAAALVTWSGNGNAYGGTIQSVCFEMTGAAQANAILAFGVNAVTVDDCFFFFGAATPAATAVAIWAYNLANPSAGGDDSSWWRITNNWVGKGGLVKFGSSSSDTVAVDADANQNVIRDNMCTGRRVNPGDSVAPAIELNRAHRTSIRDNNIEAYTVGILLRGCFQCAEAADGGEQVQKFLRLVNTRSTDLAPMGSSNAGNIGAGVSAVSSIAAAGSGYVVNDTITLTGGTFSTAAVLTVTAVSGGGVTAASVTTAGSYSVNPSNPVAQGSTSGAGTGATFNVTFAGAPAVLVALESTSTSNTVRTPATTSTDVLYGTTAGAFSVDSTSPLSAQTIITTDPTSKPAYRVFPKSAVRSNQWGYAPEVGALATSALANGQMKYVPLGVDRAATIITIGIEVTSAGASGSTIRLGIYADDGSGFPTGLPLLDAGTIDSTGTGFKSITGLTLAIQRGLYWLACAGQGSSGTTPQVRCIGGIASGVVPLAGPVGGTNCSGYQDAGTITGAFTTASPTSNATGPIIAVRYQ